MPHLNISKAAQTVGVSRATIHRRIKSGDLTATVDRNGKKQIDHAELLRVFGDNTQPVKSVRSVHGERTGVQSVQYGEQQSTPPSAHYDDLVAQLKSRIAELQSILKECREERKELLGAVLASGRLLEHKKGKGKKKLKQVRSDTEDSGQVDVEEMFRPKKKKGKKGKKK